MAEVLPGLPDVANLRVILGDHVVPRELWRYARPKPGTSLVLRVLPTNDIRSALSLVVLVASVAAAGPLGAAIAGGLGVTSAAGIGAITGLTTAGLAFAGSALLNAFIPIRADQAKGDPAASSPTYSIQGFRNQANPNGVIPNVLGRHRFAPPYAALPYSTISFDQQYVNVLFCLGYGPLLIENLRLGEAPLANFLNYSTEIKEGYPTDTAITFIPQQVIEDSPGLEFPNGEATSIQRVATTATRCVGIAVDVLFPRGLGTFTDAGGINPRAVTIQIDYKLVGAPTWITALTPVISESAKDPIRRTFGFGLPEGQYDIRVQRISSTSTDFKIQEEFVWTSLRTYREGYPLHIEADKPMALIALVIKASDQLNGMVDDFNCDVTRVCEDWDAETETWILRATQNPASLYRYVLQCNANAYPILNDKIDIPGLQDWHEFCDEHELTYNRIHDFNASLFDVLSDVAAAGRASPRHDGSKWGIVIDRPQGVITGHISPRNSWGFTAERPYIKWPDAFRVPFINEEDNYQQAERIVTWPNFVGTEDDVETTEELQLPGVTNPELVFTEARRRQLEAEQRIDKYTVNMDFENLIFTRGDLAMLSHDVLDRTQVAARVKNIIGSTAVIDVVVDYDPMLSYACRFRAADGSSQLKTVLNVTVGEDSTALLLSGDMPEIGDLALFGRASVESRPVIITSIETMENLTARLTMVDSAEDVSTFPVPPPFVPPSTPSEPLPLSDIPEIVAAYSGASTIAISEDYSSFYSLVVELADGGAGSIPAFFELQHRINGLSPEADWQSEIIPAGQAFVYLEDYEANNEVALRARAANADMVWSSSSAETLHTVIAFPPDIAIIREDDVLSPDTERHYLARETGSAFIREDA